MERGTTNLCPKQNYLCVSYDMVTFKPLVWGNLCSAVTVLFWVEVQVLAPKLLRFSCLDR